MTNQALNELETDRITSLARQGDLPGLRRAVADASPTQLAELLGGLPSRERGLVFRVLPRDLAADTVAQMEPDLLKATVAALTDEEVRQVLADLEPDERTAVLEELPGQVTQRLLNLLDPAALRQTTDLLGYPAESAGRLMTPDYVAVRDDWTVGRALEHIRRRGVRPEEIAVIYVVDAGWKLLDALELGRFILADPDQPVSSIMDHTYIAVPATADRERVVKVMADNDLFAVPVVDSAGVLLGTVTVDDVLQVQEKEATEDIEKGAAVLPLRMAYRATSILGLYRRRIVWLLALVVLNLVSSGVIAAFEEVLAASIALAFFIPLLIDSGGNSGAQSATLMVRGLATGDLRLGQWAWVFGREVLVGAALGVSLGVAASLLGIFRGGPEIGLIVGLTMVSIIMVANLVGAMLPFILTRLKLDPAVASSPLITSIADATGLLIYFSIATVVLGGALDLDLLETLAS